jgi:hypothetical protein
MTWFVLGGRVRRSLRKGAIHPEFEFLLLHVELGIGVGFGEVFHAASVVAVHVRDDHSGDLLGLNAQPRRYLMCGHKAVELRSQLRSKAGIDQRSLAALGPDSPDVVIDLNIVFVASVKERHGQRTVDRPGRLESKDFVKRSRPGSFIRLIASRGCNWTNAGQRCRAHCR